MVWDLQNRYQGKYTFVYKNVYLSVAQIVHALPVALKLGKIPQQAKNYAARSYSNSLPSMAQKQAKKQPTKAGAVGSKSNSALIISNSLPSLMQNVTGVKAVPPPFFNL